jgi:nitroreductase
MDVIEAIRTRRSIRAFKPDPVPQATLRTIMEVALRAPSWSNTQPWEFTIVSGTKLKAIIGDATAKTGVKAAPDFPGPGVFPEPFKTRFIELAARISEATQARSPEAQKEEEWYLRGPKFYGAPAVIYICTDHSFCHQSGTLNVWPLFDCGLVAENIMLLAPEFGLGTIALAQAVHYPDILREHLAIPDSKLIVLGIAIGYPDWDNTINGFSSDREGVDEVVRWSGFA